MAAADMAEPVCVCFIRLVPQRQSGGEESIKKPPVQGRAKTCWTGGAALGFVSHLIGGKRYVMGNVSKRCAFMSIENAKLRQNVS